jgi:predicted nucleotidyltransferase
MKTILKAIVGSHAYGMSNPNSDIDYAGVFVHPTDTILGLATYQETISHTSSLDKEASPDTTFHEAEKFLRLCLDGNPTVTELLWLDGYLESTLEGRLLIDHRKSFLSQRVRRKYGGYARGQFQRLQNRGDFSSTLKKRTEKHARHMYRLIFQATEILTTGHLTVKLPESAVRHCFEMGRLAEQNQEKFCAASFIALDALDALDSDLPVEPDIELANDLLLFIRKLN